MLNHHLPLLLGAIFLCVGDVFVQGAPPTTQPLLIYNCAKMPAICRNVNQRNPLLAVVGNLQAGNLGRLNPGNTPGGLDYLTLTFDTNANNKRGRRNRACPSSWKLGNPCPKLDQPLTVASGDSWSFGGYIGQGWNRAPLGQLVLGQAGYNVIADVTNAGPSGMMWTCDEWPPAMLVLFLYLGYGHPCIQIRNCCAPPCFSGYQAHRMSERHREAQMLQHTVLRRMAGVVDHSSAELWPNR